MKKIEKNDGRNHLGVVAAAVALFLAVGVYLFYEGWCEKLMVAWMLLFILLLTARKDWETMTIPNRYIGMLLLPAFLSLAVEPVPGLASRISGFFAVSLPMLLLTTAVKGSFGGGDIKLMAVCGFILGVGRILTAAFLGILSGGIYAVGLLMTHRKNGKDHFAFGPFLAFGIMVSYLYGDKIIRWYLGFLTA